MIPMARLLLSAALTVILASAAQAPTRSSRGKILQMNQFETAFVTTGKRQNATKHANDAINTTVAASHAKTAPSATVPVAPAAAASAPNQTGVAAERHGFPEQVLNVGAINAGENASAIVAPAPVAAPPNATAAIALKHIFTEQAVLDGVAKQGANDIAIVTGPTEVHLPPRVAVPSAMPSPVEENDELQILVAYIVSGVVGINRAMGSYVSHLRTRYLLAIIELSIMGAGILAYFGIYRRRPLRKRLSTKKKLAQGKIPGMKADDPLAYLYKANQLGAGRT